MTALSHPSQLWDAWLDEANPMNGEHLLFRKHWDRLRAFNPAAVDALRAYLEECTLAQWSLPREHRVRALTWDAPPSGVSYLISLRKSRLEPGDLLREDVLWDQVSAAVPLRELPFAWDVVRWAVWLLKIRADWRADRPNTPYTRAELTSWEELVSEVWGLVRSWGAEGRWARARIDSVGYFPSLQCSNAEMFTGVSLRSARFWLDQLLPYLQEAEAATPPFVPSELPLTEEWCAQAEAVRQAVVRFGGLSGSILAIAYAMALSSLPGREVPVLTLRDPPSSAYPGVWRAWPILLFRSSEEGEVLLLSTPRLDLALTSPDVLLLKEIGADEIPPYEGLPRNPKIAEPLAHLLAEAGLPQVAAAVLRRFG